MVIFITVGILFITVLALLIVRFALPEFRYQWLLAAGGSLIAWFSVITWQAAMPLLVSLPAWQPVTIFRQPPLFVADGISWAFALSIVTINTAVILTAVARDNFPSPVNWIGTLFLTAFGVMAVAADNPLTLVLLWAAIDITEAASQMRSVENPKMSERIVIAFSSRIAGTLILLWASMISASNGFVLDFLSPPPRAGLFIILASAFRLGVLPLHLPYAAESTYRRGFGTAMRMISAGSSLVVLARIPLSGVESNLTPYLILFVTIAALFGAWNWMRSPDELSGRPYWVLGMGALAVASTLRGNPLGATAWSCALILSGGSLFLASAQIQWLKRVLWIAVFGISALPLSITASGWYSERTGLWFATPFLILAQALLMAGFVRQNQRAVRTTFENQPIWAVNVYPFGIYLTLFTILLLGFFGWDGKLRLGNLLASASASLLTFGLLWLTPRVRILNPVRTSPARADNPSWINPIYTSIWNTYRSIRRLLTTFSNVLEGESGIMWTLFFLAFFISLFSQGTP